MMPFMAMPCIEMVGGPPMSTGGPIGTAKTTVVGSSMDFAVVFFLSRGGATRPTSWHESTGRPKKDCGSPSTMTVELPMKISLSFVGGFMNGPPMGMCGGRACPFVPATARGSPLTMTVAPRTGT